MYRLIATFIVFSIALTMFAQDEIPKEDPIWNQINKLAQEYWELDSPTKDDVKKLVEALQQYIDGSKLTTDRQKIAVNLLISIFKKQNMFENILKLTEKFIAEVDDQSQLQHLLILDKLEAQLNLGKYEDLLKQSDELLKSLKKAEITDEIRLFQVKAYVYKAKTLIMLKKEDSDNIIKEIDKIIKAFENKTNILKIKFERTDLQRFIVLHPGAKLDDWSALDFNNETVHFSDFTGKKVVLFFWASWEGRCTYFFEKKIEKFLKKLANQNIEFIAISTESTEKQKQFLEDAEFNCTFLHDKQSTITRKYYVESLPYFVYVDEKANVINSGNLDYFTTLNDSIIEKEDK